MTQMTENPKPESGPREKPEEAVDVIQYKKRFEQAVADAQYMMIYASSNLQNDIAQGTAERIIKARQRVEKGEELSVEDEAGFWLDYQELWKLVQPATAESIKANLPNENTSTSKARGTVNRHIIFTVSVLILLLLLQIYWVIGNQLTTQAAELLQKETDLSLELNENQREYSELEIRYKQNEVESGNFNGAYYNFYYSPEWERDILDNTSTKASLETNLELLKSQLERSSAILLAWSSPWIWLIDDNTKNDEINLAHNDKYAPLFNSIDGQIEAINQQLKNDPKGTIEAEKQSSSLDAQLSSINGQLNVLSEQYGILDTNERDIQEQINKIDQKSALDAQLADLQTSQKTIEGQIKDLNDQLSALDPTADKSALETRLADLQASQNAIDGQITDVNTDLSALLDVDTSSKSSLETQVNDVRTDKTALIDQIQYLQDQIPYYTVDQQALAEQIVSQWEQNKKSLESDKRALLDQEKADAKREKSRLIQFQTQLAGQFVLVILQSYMLPLLYGILGAGTSVLRTLSKQIETVTYSEEAGIQHLLRISLGALAGIMVGWFSFLIPSETTTFVGSISPLAIAFLVGYNIELFFSLMDRALFSITDRLQRPSPTKQEEQKPIPNNAPTSPVKPTTPAMETPAPGEAEG